MSVADCPPVGGNLDEQGLGTSKAKQHGAEFYMNAAPTTILQTCHNVQGDENDDEIKKEN